MPVEGRAESRSPSPEMEEDDSTAAMAAMMGFGGFDTTKVSGLTGSRNCC